MNNYTEKTDQKDLGIMTITFFHFYRNHVFNVLVNIKGKNYNNKNTITWN